MLDTLTILVGFGALAVGCVIGWFIRAQRSQAEKNAINAGWREQQDAQNSESKRIEQQNRSLIRQVSELQLKLKSRSGGEHTIEAPGDDSEPSTAASEAAGPVANDNSQKLAKARQRVRRLQGELKKWQERLPPLIARYRERDADAKRLEAEAAEARALIARYEQQPSFDETRAGAYPPGDPDTATDASNDMLATDPSGALLAVKGIGPKTCKRLADMGYKHLSDLAGASDEDIERIDADVQGARGKARGWRKQAISLLESLEQQ